ncbi:MAG: hypothetical protein Q8908_13925 [Bacteroidota bacterium]|nr:hypothetical protein [Bacteroidota bacterium]
MEEAFDSVKKLSIQSTEPPKSEKKSKNDNCCSIDSCKPCLYIDDRELPTAGNYKIDDKVVLVLECSVKGISSYMRPDGKGQKKTLNIDLTVDAIADITKG